MFPDPGDLAQMAKNDIYHTGRSGSSVRTEWRETKINHHSNLLRLTGAL